MEAAMKSFSKFRKRFFPAFLFILTLFLFACDDDSGGKGGGGGGDSPVVVNETSFMHNGEIITLETDPCGISSPDIKIFKYNPVNKTRVYLNSSNGPINRIGFSQVLFNDKIIIFGGHSFELITNEDGDSDSVYTYHNDIWQYDIPSQKWTKLESENGPEARSRSLAVVYNNKMIVCAGFCIESNIYISFDDIWQYNIGDKIWEQLQSNTGGLSYSAEFLIIKEDAMIVMSQGGKICSYNFNSQVWQELKTLSSPIMYASYTYDGTNYIYYYKIDVIDHDPYHSESKPQLWRYNVITNQLAQLNYPDIQKLFQPAFIYAGSGQAYLGGGFIVPDDSSMQPRSNDNINIINLASLTVLDEPSDPGTGAPAIPANLNVSSATASSLTISWNSVSGANSYNVYRSSTSGGTYTLISSPTTTSYTDTNLNENTTYYYKVSAANNYGESDKSSSQSGTTTSSGGTFTPGTGAFSIPTGTYTLSGTSYTFKAGNKLDMTTDGQTVSDISYSYNTSTGALIYSQEFAQGMTMSYTYYNCFTVSSSGTTYLIMPGFKKTSGTADSIIGTYEFSMSTDVAGTVTEMLSSITYNSNGTYTVTTSVTGQSPQTDSGTWDANAHTVTGYNFVTINGGLYMYVPGQGYEKQ